MKYRFFPAADMAQDKIWDYTSNKWGEAQAEKYIKGLHRHIEQLAEKQKLWRPLPTRFVIPLDLKTKAYFSLYEKHYIFFRELSGGVLGVMSILHEKMHLPVRLVNDLKKIE